MLNIMRKNSLLLLFVVIGVFSCRSKTFDSADEMNKFVSEENNGYCYKKEVKGVIYTLQYRPTDLLVLQELGADALPVKVEQLRKKYENYLYFNLSMSLNNRELLSDLSQDRGQFGQMVSDLAFNMDQKIHLYTVEKDTIPIADFVYPRMYGISQATTIMVVYPRKKQYLNQKYLNFAVEDLGLDTGEVRFKVLTQPLTNEPLLNF